MHASARSARTDYDSDYSFAPGRQVSLREQLLWNAFALALLVVFIALLAQSEAATAAAR